MPKPYHTPKSERDEIEGALIEAEDTFDVYGDENRRRLEEEAAQPSLRFSGEFIDANNHSAGYDFKATSEAQAIEKMRVEALMPPPELGPVYGMMLYCYDAPGGWIEVEVP